MSSFPRGTVRTLLRFMEGHPDVGMVCPQDPERMERTKYLNKRYPNVLDLFLRRFLCRMPSISPDEAPSGPLRDAGRRIRQACDVEVMSGALHALPHPRAERSVRLIALFLYFEDFDLSRKFP